MAQSPSRIALLPAVLIEKIAAGEVIERPASVVKELVENAIDAHASRIDISLDDGGFALIEIRDNGMGIAREDLALSIVRHATSKIRSLDDLFSIATMGFRGEALASVAAVSRFTIESSQGDDGAGYSLTFEGALADTSLPPAVVRPCAHTRGTTVACRDLFFNVPARKKFMKSSRAERMAAGRLLEQIIIPFPQIHFTVTFDGKRVIDAPAVESVLQRIAQVNGAAFAQTLAVCHGAFSDLEATVFMVPPQKDGGQRRLQNLYVNTRRIDNDSVAFALREGYTHFAPPHTRPSYFCLLQIDPRRIDVNVHPTKQRIKFDDERLLFSRMVATVRQGLGAAISGFAPTSVDIRQDLPQNPGPSPVWAMEEGLLNMFEQAAPAAPAAGQASEARVAEDKAPLFALEKELAPGHEGTVQLLETVSDKSWNLISCFQIHGCYILAPIKNGIVLIDQHAAHERILFEQALRQLKSGQADAAQLLFPVVVELTAVEKSVVLSASAYFSSFGFSIDDFGGNAITVSATPPFLSGVAIEAAIREIVRCLLDEKESRAFTEPVQRFAAAFACGAAIKAGQKLSQEEMNGLFSNLFAAENPYICPHGRPTLIRISIDELSRRFLR